MEKVSIPSYFLIGLLFILAYFANMSTNQVRRQQLYVSYFVLLLLVWSASFIYMFMFRAGFLPQMLILYNLFCGFGVILPQLISRIFIRQKISHPVVFLNKKIPLFIILPVIFLVITLISVYLLPPLSSNLAADMLIYSWFDVFWSITFLIFFIPGIILYLELAVERNAICDNGLYQGGLISDWSNFKSYTWPQSEIYVDSEIQPFLSRGVIVDLVLEPKASFFRKQIRVTIPLQEKNAIESLLAKKIKGEQTLENSIFPKPA